MQLSNQLSRVVIVSLIGLAGCSSEDTRDASLDRIDASPSGTESQMISAAEATNSFTWPDTLRVMGDGYPKSGDPCRRLGETAATSNFLDHTAVLIGCPGDATSAAATSITANGSARVVGAADGVTFISVPGTSAAASRTGGPTSFAGNITGNAIATHRFTASEGDTVNVTLDGPGSMYFNVLPPGGGPGDAIFVGSRAVDDANTWSAVAPSTGEYSIIVYMMGNDKDSGATRSYELEVAKN